MSNEVAKKSQTIVDSTLARINEMKSLGNLTLPPDYSAPNALNAAWLILQEVKTMDKKPVLEACTRESIAYALLSMAIQGLNPMKRQCSFIAYGNKLNLQREYQGSIAIAKRAGLKSVIANPIFNGDEFAVEVDAETGRKKIVKHVPSWESFGGEVKGAYAVIEMQDGSKNIEVMSISQIRAAWNQGATKGQSPAHKNFPDQMACKTVINRALKTIINSSDDSALFEEDDQPLVDAKTSHVHQVIEDNSNKSEIGFEEEVIGQVTEAEEVVQENSIVTDRPGW
ncbi:MAG TPA: recombinase RecT [Gammaproteobacteria bacterium]|nr:recombinase RecT [Gammaproteobacteria bacterium]